MGRSRSANSATNQLTTLLGRMAPPRADPHHRPDRVLRLRQPLQPLPEGPGVLVIQTAETTDLGHGLKQTGLSTIRSTTCSLVNAEVRCCKAAAMQRARLTFKDVSARKVGTERSLARDPPVALYQPVSVIVTW